MSLPSPDARVTVTMTQTETYNYTLTLDEFAEMVLDPAVHAALEGDEVALLAAVKEAATEAYSEDHGVEGSELLDDILEEHQDYSVTDRSWEFEF